MFADQLVKKVKAEINLSKMSLEHHFSEAKLHHERTQICNTLNLNLLNSSHQ